MTGFPRLWAATGLSKIGDGLLLVGLPLYAASVSHGSVLAVSLVAFACRLPWLLVSLPAGAFADRRPYRRVMVQSDLARFALVALLAVLVVTHRAGVPVLLVIGFALGAFDTTFSAAAVNGLPAVVPDGELARAGGRLFAAEAAGEQVIGPAAAGLLYSIGAAVPFVGDAVSFLVSAVLLRGLPPTPPTSPVTADTPGGRTTLRRDMREGVAHFAANRPVRLITVLISAWAFGQAAAYALQVLLFTETLGLTARAFGILIAATAVANVGGGLIAERVWKHLGTMPLVALAGVTVAAAFVVAARTSSPWVAAAAFGVESLVLPWAFVAATTLRLQATPAEVRGKVMNISRTVVIGAASIGALVAGPVASRFGLRAPLYVGAAAYAVPMVLAWRPLRRTLGSPAPTPPAGGAPRVDTDRQRAATPVPA